MKRFVTFLLALFFVVLSEAQTVKSNQISAAHLDFLSVPLNGNESSFVSRLEKNGIIIPMVRGEVSNIKFGDFQFDDAYVGTYFNNNVYKISLIGLFDDTYETLYAFEGLFDYIVQTYPDAQVFRYHERDAMGDERVFSIGDLGVIKLNFDAKQWNRLTLDFIDKENYDRMKGVDSSRRWYDIHSLYPKSKQCLVGITDEEVLFSVQLEGKYYSFSSRGKDKEFIDFMFKNSVDLNITKDLFNRYITQAIKQIQPGNESIRIFRDDIVPICNQMTKERQMLQEAQQIVQETGQNLIVDLLLDAVMNKKEQKYYENLVGREGLKALTKGIISIATYQGEGDYSCSTCGLVFPSYDLKRSHENLNHGY